MVMLRFSLFVVSFCLTILSMAQSDLESILKSERRSYENKLLFKKSAITETYNVVYQRLEVDINPKRYWIYGKVTTSFKPLKSAFNTMQFDLENYLRVDSVIFHGNKIPFTHANKLVTIQLPVNLTIAILDSVSVFYQGNPTMNNPHESFIYDVHDFKNPKPIAWTLSEPYGARGWWPCKESLTDKIDSLDVVVTVSKGNKAASNGLLIVQKVINDSQEVYHWRHRYPIVTYLVAVAVTNYVAYTDYLIYPGKDTLPILNYVYPESEAEARTLTPMTAKMIRLFDSLFGKYPFYKEKYGHAQFGWSGGMEHQTMSFMGNLKFDLVAHELAHQWFGNATTCGTWHDIWLNEGFATYLTALAAENLNTKADFRNRMSISRSEVVKENGGSVYVRDTADRSRLFSGRLSYNKGAFLLHMLRWKLGDKVFYAGVKNYLNTPGLLYGFARTNDLQIALENASGQSLDEFFKDWFYGEGHPDYSIRWSHVGNHLSLRILQSTSHPSVSFFNIPLPFYVSGASNDTMLVLEPSVNDTTYTIDLDFVPTQLQFDPHVWILCKSNTLEVKPLNSPDIHVYPVPASQLLSVNNYVGNIEVVQIYDMAGRLVFDKDYKKENVIKDAHEIDIRFLSEGMYIIAIGNGSGTARQWFVKE